MDQLLRDAIFAAVEKEPFAKAFNLRLVELARGYSRVEMIYEPEQMDNIYQRAHGGAIFGLIDEAFETASQTGGSIAVALNVSVTYMTSPGPRSRLTAEARQISESRRTSHFDISVTDEAGQLIASCRALAYRTGKPVPLPPCA
jgi:acyl-CoA thioesterase